MCSILAASTKQISFTFLVYLHECQKKSIVINYNYKYSKRDRNYKCFTRGGNYLSMEWASWD